MHRGLVLIVAASLLGVAASPPAAAVKSELKKLAGTWRTVSYITEGKKPVADEDLEQTHLLIYTDGRFRIERNGVPFVEGALRPDPTKKPKAMELVYNTGPDEGQLAHAIYELTSDTLKLCRSVPGQQRPREFSSKEGSGHVLAVYRREKPSAKPK